MPQTEKTINQIFNIQLQILNGNISEDTSVMLSLTCYLQCKWNLTPCNKIVVLIYFTVSRRRFFLLKSGNSICNKIHFCKVL